MPISDYKVNPLTEYAGRDHASNVDSYSGTAAAGKARFDALIKYLIEYKYNLLADALASTDEGKGISMLGMEPVDGMDASDPQAAIEEIYTALKAVTDGASGADYIGCTPVGSGTAETVQGVLEELNTAISTNTGWIPFAFTCTRASDTTFTVAGDITAILRYGVKFRCTQTTDKDFYVVSSSYSAPNTTVTVTGEDVLTAADMENPLYSLADMPAGFKKGELWYRAYATNSAAHNVATGTDTVKVQLNTEAYDPNGNFDSVTNYHYTAPISGYYKISGTIALVTNAAAYEIMGRLVGTPNPAAFGRFNTTWSATGTCVITGSKTCYLAKGANVSLGVYQASGSTRTVEANGCMLSIQFIGV